MLNKIEKWYLSRDKVVKERIMDCITWAPLAIIVVIDVISTLYGIFFK